jgi:hypothetical protein
MRRLSLSTWCRIEANRLRVSRVDCDAAAATTDWYTISDWRIDITGGIPNSTHHPG